MSALKLLKFVVKTFTPTQSQLVDLLTILNEDKGCSQKRRREEAEKPSSSTHTSKKETCHSSTSPHLSMNGLQKIGGCDIS